MTSTNTTEVSPHDQNGGVDNTPDPAAPPTKRSFSTAEKLTIVSDYDALAHGEKGEFLRANGLYSSQISECDENHGNSPEAIIEIPHPVRAAVGH